MALWKAGNKCKAMEYFQKCIDITPDVAHQFIEVSAWLSGVCVIEMISRF
jgi:hypothetical protein